jgi:hypothetical protein
MFKKHAAETALMFHVRSWRTANLGHRALQVEKQRHDPHTPIAEQVAENANKLDETQQQVKGLAESIQRIERLLMQHGGGQQSKGEGSSVL